jgi:eukaryotic-like serine/threonine-protein kinase
VRHELLQEAAQCYATFADEAENDPQLKKELAAAYGKLGRQCDEFGANQEAIDAHGQAVRLYREVSRTAGAGGAVQRQLAVAHNNLGLALARDGKRVSRRNWVTASTDLAIAARLRLA